MEYKVIKILNEKEIVIDYGEENGALKEEKIIIFEPGIEIIYKNKNYGEMYKIKEKLEIVEVYQQFSICQKITIEESSYNILFHNPLNRVRKIKKIKEINVGDVPNLEKTTYRSYEPVKLGDKVKIIK
ncbi:hypothetical protein [Streptobacillus ratti]|uniref:hypothetical protein n=1 Tax=Streptobacillus ratti TaxID=1720557 RepID=UPI00093343B1|nr:hypothetical protein [Streptobacillus ratti]